MRTEKLRATSLLGGARARVLVRARFLLLLLLLLLVLFHGLFPLQLARPVAGVSHALTHFAVEVVARQASPPLWQKHLLSPRALGIGLGCHFSFYLGLRLRPSVVLRLRLGCRVHLGLVLRQRLRPTRI